MDDVEPAVEGFWEGGDYGKGAGEGGEEGEIGLLILLLGGVGTGGRVLGMMMGVMVRMEVKVVWCPGEHCDCTDFVACVEFGAADEALASEGFWVYIDQIC